MAGTAGRSGHRFTLDEVRRLRSDPTVLAAADGLALSESSLIGDLTRLRGAVGELAGAVVETVRLRRRAVEKFGPQAATWWLTEEALQQGTPAAVARHRWGRLAQHGLAVHDLTCSIGADLYWAPDGSVGSDLDPVRVRMADGNLPGRPVFVADALTRTSRGLLGYADPARRDGGRRITGIDTLPPLADLDQVHAQRPPVLRMPPGIDHVMLARPGETEIVSLDGGAREAVLWPAEVATVSRRASVLRSTPDGHVLHESVTSDDSDDSPVLPVGAYLFDPDAAIVRAGLVRHWAARHGLAQIDPHLAYLTGDRPVPQARSFRVIEVAPFTEKVVKAWVKRDGTGTLEIKQRGTPVVPDELRQRLRPVMSKDTRQARTLIVARVGSGRVAIWTEAVPA